MNPRDIRLLTAVMLAAEETQDEISKALGWNVEAAREHRAAIAAAVSTAESDGDVRRVMRAAKNLPTALVAAAIAHSMGFIESYALKLARDFQEAEL